MAIVLSGMNDEETAWLTDAMVRSGERVDLSDVPGVKVGKHSTGGVGDKVSIVLAPVAAACGVVVPKMSGRGLGHTGGTLDKLESIPGYRIDLTIDEFKQVLRDVGTSIIGQTAALAPADKKLYALRDVTATVESIPLISASIMSKKLAEGSNALVLDVKCGDGAFMKDLRDARALAESMVAIGTPRRCAHRGVHHRHGRAARPRRRQRARDHRVPRDAEGQRAGRADRRRFDVLAARMVLLAGQSIATRPPRPVAWTTRCPRVARSQVFAQLIERQGGNPRVVDDYSLLPSAPDRELLRATRGGYVTAMHAEAIGRASHALGAGRSRVGDAVDHAVGIVVTAKPGDPVKAGEPLLELHHRGGRGLEAALALCREAISDRRRAACSAGRRCWARCDERRRNRRAAASQPWTQLGPDACSAALPRSRPWPSGLGFAGASRVQPVAGLALILALAYCLSSARHAIDYRTVAWGLGLQFLFALIVLKTDVGRAVFQTAGGVITKLLNFAYVGSSFVFGPLGNPDVWPRIMTGVLGPEGSQYANIFAFMVLPTIIFIAALFAMLYYFGVMQFVVRAVRGHHAPLHARERRRVAERRRQHLHGADRGAADHPAVPAADDRVRADDGDDGRHGAHLRRRHGGLHPVRRRGAASADRGDHDGAGHADDGEDVRARDRTSPRRWER